MNRFALETTADGDLRIIRYGHILSRAEVQALVQDLSAWLDASRAVAAVAEPPPVRVAGRAEGSGF